MTADDQKPSSLWPEGTELDPDPNDKKGCFSFFTLLLAGLIFGLMYALMKGA